MNITIPGEAIAKKNRMRVIKFGKRASIRTSKLYDQYACSALNHLMGYKPWRGNYPVIVEMYFYRETLRSFDFDNLQNSIQDILVSSGIIEDDTMNHVIPKIKDHGWEKDKDNPRAEITISEYIA